MLNSNPSFLNALASEHLHLVHGTGWFNKRYQNVCDSTYRKVVVVGRLDFEIRGCKVKYLEIWSQRSILRFHLFWNLRLILSSLLEGFGVRYMTEKILFKHIKGGDSWKNNTQVTNISCSDFKCYVDTLFRHKKWVKSFRKYLIILKLFDSPCYIVVSHVHPRNVNSTVINKKVNIISL